MIKINMIKINKYIIDLSRIVYINYSSPIEIYFCMTDNGSFYMFLKEDEAKEVFEKLSKFLCER